MATIPANNYAHDVQDRFELPVDSTGANPINQGDIVQWVVASGFMKVVAAAASLLIVGVADGTFPTTSGLDVGPVSTGTRALILPVRRRGVFYLFMTAGETYNPFTVVYIGADAQTVTTVSTTNTQVGFIDPDNFLGIGDSNAAFSGGVSGPNPFPITGVAGKRIRVILATNFPVAAESIV